MNIIPKGKNLDNINTNVKSSYFNQGNQFYLQSNVTIPKDGFIITQIRGLFKKSCMFINN